MTLTIIIIIIIIKNWHELFIQIFFSEENIKNL
jgi:hypothetical protein